MYVACVKFMYTSSIKGFFLKKNDKEIKKGLTGFKQNYYEASVSLSQSSRSRWLKHFLKIMFLVGSAAKIHPGSN